MEPIESKAAEKLAWETEKSTYKLAQVRADAEIARLRNELKEIRSRPQTPRYTSNEDEARFRHLYKKCLQIESWRKSLVWQKKYLLSVISVYESTETKTMNKLDNISERLTKYTKMLNLSSATSNNKCNRFRFVYFILFLIIFILYPLTTFY